MTKGAKLKKTGLPIAVIDNPETESQNYFVLI